MTEPPPFSVAVMLAEEPGKVSAKGATVPAAKLSKSSFPTPTSPARKLVRGPVLEIGVSTGRLFAEARRRGADIHGVDGSPACV